MAFPSMNQTSATARRIGLATVLIAFASFVGAQESLASPVLTQNLFGGPGPSATVDAGFLALGGTAKESYGFEGNVNLTNQQIRINALTGLPPATFTFGVAANSAFQFFSARQYDFTMEWDGDATKGLNVKMFDPIANITFAINYNAAYGDVKTLLFRARTPVNGTNNLTSSSITFEGLKLGSTSFSDVITLNSNGSDNLANYFSITNFDFTQAWKLTGKVTTTWAGGTPQGNRLNWQIKGFQEVVPANVVPEPSTIASAALASLVGLACAVRRGRKA